MIKEKVPSSVMKRSLVSPSLVAEVIYKKYMNGMSLYRQEHEWLQRGFKFSRFTILSQE